MVEVFFFFFFFFLNIQSLFFGCAFFLCFMFSRQKTNTKTIIL